MTRAPQPAIETIVNQQLMTAVSHIHTTLRGPQSLRFCNLAATFEPISGGCEIVTKELTKCMNDDN